MGGHALTKYGLTTVRYSKDQYLPVETDVVSKLKTEFQLVAVPRSIRGKNSFGDLDVLVSKPHDSELTTPQLMKLMPVILKNLFGYDQIYANSNCFSFNYGLGSNKDFQVDVIFMEEDNFYSAYNYFSFPDSGNLIGRIVHKTGLSFGHDGLKYIYRSETNHVFGKVYISKDIEKILTFFGYDYKRWEAGFDTIIDVYEFVESTPYFDSTVYDLDDESINHTNRVRNKKRENYMNFITYIENKYKRPRKYFTEGAESIWLMKADKYFPDAQLFEHMSRMYEEHVVQVNTALKFNGNDVIGITGLTGKELGKFMKFLKDHLDEDLSLFIQHNTYDEIVNRVKVFFEVFKREETKKERCYIKL